MAEKSPGDGTTSVLTDEGAATLLTYAAEFSLAGRLAAVGSRPAEMAVQKVAEDFFQAFAMHFVAPASDRTAAWGGATESNPAAAAKPEAESAEATAVIRPARPWTVHPGPVGIFERFRRRRARGSARSLERHLGVLAVSLGASLSCAFEQAGITYRMIRATFRSNSPFDPLATGESPRISGDLLVECELSEDALRKFYLERPRDSWFSDFANEFAPCDVRVRVLSRRAVRAKPDS